MRAVHAFVSGDVQGVYFRQGTRHKARALGLIGWVRNLSDGRVELWAQGPEEGIGPFLDWLWEGPPEARVTGVESSDVAPDPRHQDFVILR